ncbi:MAG TPA: Rab family GTPase [Methanomassiliicoccales archaeon]|jgi:small GTP-binding protein
MEKKQFIRKVCLIGDGAVGKTSLVRRYVLDVFGDDYISTFGAKVSKKVITLGDVELTIMIWDILGQKGGASMHSAYFSGANGAFMVCDNTRQDTVESLNSWFQEFSRVAGKVPVIPLVNKCDLIPQATEDSLRSLSAVIGRDFRRTSAKTGEGVEEAFLQLGKLMVGG